MMPVTNGSLKHITSSYGDDCMWTFFYYAHGPSCASTYIMKGVFFYARLPDCIVEETNLLLTIFKDYPDVVTIPQLCEMLGGISSKSTYKLLQANRILHFKIGRAYKIPKVHVIAHLQPLIHSQQINAENNFTLSL
ncbi:helix-turn-helix domain-containing protein [Paenibacillus polymyxa]|uniref:helix-turn-helix domain-containing protein n=2 Tax=Paenibacillus polymyxa TaxID=1406 RepID=UPI0030039580